ncbi:ornithine cyclodeaminase [Rhodovulum sp. 12E13]|uniref:ornithine cyclodeaminase family protein n=1 Tax=Rhodovulum sp. 12E13 TaxID=2203891 RepID=UPI000E1A0EC9|nr:Gfo/Idh/MocA family oxidoreductase [Rhodovulum sp. 12E13]RDC69857.1 ornithine cyclodeaminase [Rhodovulum sp. 12E13]
MNVPMIPFDAGERLDWIAVSDAIAAGHALPRAELGDTFLTRGSDTLLSRAAWIDGMGALVKTATVFPGNAARGRPTINGGVALYGDVDGALEAMVDFHLLTRWKTAADSLLAARRLAPPRVRGILIVGAGTVAGAMAAAYRAAFPDARVALWNRTRHRAEKLAAETGAAVAPDLEQAARTADIICCATMSVHPVLQGAWLRPGQHVDLIGAFRADMREADDAALTRSRVFVDSRETVLDHIGELKDPIARGVITAGDVVADFYELDRFTRDPDDITLCKNGGGAHLDLMVARHILERWQSDGD